MSLYYITCSSEILKLVIDVSGASDCLINFVEFARDVSFSLLNDVYLQEGLV